MSRLDRHIAMVRGKLALGLFVRALAWTLLVFAALVWVAVLVHRFFLVAPPQPWVWFWAGLAAAGLAAFVYSIWKRPTGHAAAVAIDERLGLREKFSTALYARRSADPFAQAAVRDAERTADNVSLSKQFPLPIPRTSYGTLAVALMAFLTFTFLDPVDLFGKEEARRREVAEQIKREDAKKVVEQALAQVNAMPRVQVTDEPLRVAQEQLELLLNEPIRNPEQTKRNAAKALTELNEALKQKVAESQKYANSKTESQLLKDLMPAPDEQGPVADAQRELADGNFDQAIESLERAVDDFANMTEEQRQQQAEQMQKMASQLEQMANDPQVQEQVKEQLEQLGMDQQQAQQVMDQMQRAAQGDQQAAQQLQQQAQQMMQQMNNGQGPTQQQQQQIQQMMQQMQAQMNGQQQAQQMAQAAQQMAQAMQQAQQAAQQGQQGQQQQNPQAGQQQQAQAGQQGQQQQGQQGGQQQMQQAMQAMQQQLGAMQAMQSDAQQVAAAQQAAADAAGQAAGQVGQQPGGQMGQPGQQGQQGQQPGQGQNGQWAQGDPQNRPGNGMGGPGQGRGGQGARAQAPFGVKQELDPSEDIEGGKVIASMLIRDENERGESTAGLRELAAAAQQEATDEIDQQRVSRQAQQVVREYFRSMAEDAPQ